MAEQKEKELRSRIEALVRATRNERQAIRRASITVALVSSALLIIVAVFAFVNYRHIKSEWTEEKLAAGFQKELEVLNPSANKELRQLGQHLLPIYAQAGRQKFMDMAPEIAERINAEVNHLGAHLTSDARSRLTSSVDRIRSRTADVIFAAYPGLEAESEKEELTNSFRRLTEDSVSTTINDFAVLFATDIRKLETKIHAFNTAPTDEPTVELEKRFIHLWLQLLDAEIMKK